ncbi:g5485 [Coccomyxa elongata]
MRKGQPSVAIASVMLAPCNSGVLWDSCVHDGVLAATTAASFNIFMLCGFVGWLLHTGRIPNETAPVLSKVAFNVFIPCMLFSKVASTLATQPDLSLLAIPLVAVLQVLAGACFGSVAARIVDGSLKRSLSGWHPLNPSRSAQLLAMTTASATGVPNVAAALLPRPKNVPLGTRELVRAACTFGNSLTLPLVFLNALLPAAAFDRAVGYTALFLTGWSPLLWSLGYSQLATAGFAAEGSGKPPFEPLCMLS